MHQCVKCKIAKIIHLYQSTAHEKCHNSMEKWIIDCKLHLNAKLHIHKKTEKETQYIFFSVILKFKMHFQSRLMDRKETANCPCWVQDCGLDLGLDRVAGSS